MKRRVLAFRMHSSVPSIVYGASGLVTSSEDVPVKECAIPSHARASLLSENVIQTYVELVAHAPIHHNSGLRRSDVQMIIYP